MKYNTETFIKRAQEKFPEYDYSKSVYTKARNKLIVTCPKHGDFEVSPDNHLNKNSGCPKCKYIKGSNTVKRKAAQTFVERARTVHGDKYDYSKVEYVDSHTKVCIICPEHGEFWQTPNNHLSGNKCKLCANEQISKNQTFSTQDFIQKASIIHNNKYNYDKVKYTSCRDKVIITCPIHGDFLQTADIHLRGCGCQKCNQSHGEKEIECILQDEEIDYIYQYKLTTEQRDFVIDFYLPKYNMFIEYNGQQHYVPIEYFGGEIQFQKQLNRDNLLRTYCKANNIQLVEISYNEKNIEKALKDILLSQS